MKMLSLLLLILPLSVTAFTSQQRSHHCPAATCALFAKKDRRHFFSSVASTAIGALTATSIAPPLASAAVTPTASAVASTIAAPAFSNDLSWPLGKVAFSLLPLAGTSTRRATIEEEVVPGKIWTHDQLQGVVNVNVPVRQTVIKLSEAAGGGLWIHNPVAPTPQLLQMMAHLEEQHGPIRHVVLGTVALEHKATFGAFCRKFPNATVWIQPGQWAFPINLSIEVLGVTQRGARLREIPVAGQAVSSPLYKYFAEKNPVPEWAADFDWEVLGPLKFKAVGAFSETAFFHKTTKSLIVTDTVVSITDTPPKIIAEDPRAMLFHARDSIDEIIEDTPANRQRGWRRMVQFGLVFFPSQINVVPAGEALSKASHIDPRMKTLGEGAVPNSLYPWTWKGNADDANFQAISKKGALFCPPILTKLILDREPQRTIAWVDAVCRRFDFKRVIPSHLNNNVKAGPKEFSAAFDMLRSSPGGKTYPQRPLPEDLALLQKASDLLTRVGVVGPSQVCDGELARQSGRFAKR